MVAAFRGRRRTSNILGILFSCLTLVTVLASVPFFVWSDYAVAYSLFFPALGLNYFITLVLSLELIHSPTREDLFVNFSLFIFMIFPLVGVFLFFLLGFDSLHKGDQDIYTTISSRYRKNESGYDVLPLDSVDPDFRVFSYNFLKHATNVYRNAKIEVLDNAHKILEEMTKAVESAKRYIHMEFYMFSDGLVFDHLSEVLRRKASAGVEVRVIIDFVGNARRLSSRSLKRLKASGVEVRIFNKFFRKNHLWWQFRNHNKIIVVDNELVICGSCNVADEYFNITKKYFQTTELSVKLTGDIVGAVSAMFLSHWDLCNNRKPLSVPEFDDERSKFYFYKTTKIPSQEAMVQLVDNSPVGKGFIIRDNLMKLIFGARKSIVISTPYFYPPKELVNALKLVKYEGVSIKILVPKTPDLIGFFSTLNRQPLDTLVEHGIEVYEYFGFNHEKVMVIDDEIVYLGSYNWDYRALYLNFEHSLLVKCSRLAKTLGTFMQKQFKNSHMIKVTDLKRHKHFFLYSLLIKLFKPFL